MGYEYFCQADARWADRRLRGSTMKRVGCLITAASIKATGEGGPMSTPETIDSYMDSHGGYVSGSDSAIWAIVADAIGRDTGRQVEFVGFKTVNGNTLKDFKVPKGNFPLLRVKTSRQTNHYVLLTNAKTGEIIDPGQGERRERPHTLASKHYVPNRISLFRYKD